MTHGVLDRLEGLELVGGIVYRARRIGHTLGVRLGRFNAARESALLLAAFVAIVLVEHLLRRDLAPRDHRISEYANGSGGWVMVIAFVAWAVSLAGTAICVARGPLLPRRWVRVLFGLFLVAALGAAVTAICKTGTSAGVVPPGRELTAANHAHDVGSAILALALWATIAAGLALSDRPVRVAGIALLAVAIIAAFLLSGGSVEAPGLRQRALLGVACAWQAVLLWRSRSAAPERPADKRPAPGGG